MIHGKMRAITRFELNYWGCSTMKHIKVLFASISACIALQAQAQALNFEGVYRIADREYCGQTDRIDSIIAYSDAQGATWAVLTSKEYGIVYQKHALKVGEAGEWQGVTVPESRDAAVLSASQSADGLVLTGSVDAVSCAYGWSFTAEKVQLAATESLEPFLRQPQLADFVGSYSTKTSASEGKLRLMLLPDGRLVGNYGVEIVPRLLSFDSVRLDTTASVLELFVNDAEGVAVKWTLSYGLRDGKVVVLGSGLSRTGNLYSVTAYRN